MSISNLNKVLGQLRRWGQGFVDGGAAALVEEATKVRDLARTYVPIDTGALYESGRVMPVVRTSQSVKTEVRFGGIYEVDYAAIVHEDMTAYHPVGQAKYLQRAVDERFPGMGLRVGFVATTAAKRRSGAR